MFRTTTRTARTRLVAVGAATLLAGAGLFAAGDAGTLEKPRQQLAEHLRNAGNPAQQLAEHLRKSEHLRQMPTDSTVLAEHLRTSEHLRSAEKPVV